MLCQTCGATETPKWYGKGTECRTCYAKRRHKKIYSENPEYFRRRMREYKARAPDAIKSTELLGRFGITLVDYQRMLKEQGGCCDICKSTSPGRAGVKYFAVDHDHETGEVRALLCTRCNTGIGLLCDSSEIVRSALLYLRKHGK